ncbi:MAG: beta-ketoacyl synthase N-terminal-like domain-containing protein [Verrucomicrobiota bacterium]
MNAKIQGMGWVTPLGTGLEEVRTRLDAGERAEEGTVTSPHSNRTHRCMVVPPKLVEAMGRNPRLRRSSAISYFTASAALAALENAGVNMTPEIADRTAIVFAIASGGVVYTRKFYETVVTHGANTASPLLFPETVYNAPASHVAALLGVTGMSYTLVGDSSVGIAALKFAEQLLDTTDIDRCLVVGGEEIDWVLCETYRAWRFPMILAEGAAALVLGRTGTVAFEPIHEGVSFFNQSGAENAVRRVFQDLRAAGSVDLAVCGGNGNRSDSIERTTLGEFFPNTSVVLPKQALGEALGAGALIQTVYGALTLQQRGSGRVLISAPGLNQQASGLVLSI